MKHLAPLVLAAVLLPALVLAYTCPLNVFSTGAYQKLEISPAERYVGQEVTFTVTMNEGGESVGMPNVALEVQYISNGEVIERTDLRTDSDGEARFAPEKSGQYAVLVSKRYIFFEVISECGDGFCAERETRGSCPEDCASCGDDVCDINEDEQTCPEDCVLCGNGVCESEENRTTCPEDCAYCGDRVCDANENRKNCPDDCVLCGDGICDQQELLGLHMTSCPDDCVICGDYYCDFTENATTCPRDCISCGDGICDAGEDCPEDCDVCGDKLCGASEDRKSCPGDCAYCGDSVCDSNEMLALHDTTCSQDCSACGDAYCDYGEAESCPKDCRKPMLDMIGGYFWLILLAALALMAFEILHTKTVHAPSEKIEKRKRLEGIDFERIKPALVVLGAASGLLLLFIYLSASLAGPARLFNIFAITDIIAGSLPVIIPMAFIIGLVAALITRESMSLSRTENAIIVPLLPLVAMLIGLIFYPRWDYVALIIASHLSLMYAAASTKSMDEELKVRKPFRLGNSLCSRWLSIASIALVLIFFLNYYLDLHLDEIMAGQLAGSKTLESFGAPGAASMIEIRDNIVRPVFNADFGAFDGKLLVVAGVSLLLLTLLRIFIFFAKLLSGFYAMVFARVSISTRDRKKICP